MSGIFLKSHWKSPLYLLSSEKVRKLLFIKAILFILKMLPNLYSFQYIYRNQGFHELDSTEWDIYKEGAVVNRMGKRNAQTWSVEVKDFMPKKIWIWEKSVDLRLSLALLFLCNGNRKFTGLFQVSVSPFTRWV